MICLCREDQTLESFTDIGLFLEIADRSSYTGKLEAEIKFDIEKFVQYYIPTADLSCYGSIYCIPREIFEQLLDVELKIGPMRRNRYFF